MYLTKRIFLPICLLLMTTSTVFGQVILPKILGHNMVLQQQNKVPVVMDCTHSLQQPNQTSGITGGNPQLIGTIAKAAVAASADGLFIETHPDPARAKSDGANMLRLELLEELLVKLVNIRKAVLA